MKPQKLFSSWFKFAIADFSIAKKISSSYALTIGIAVTGTAIGLLIGNYYQKQAQNRYLFTNQQQRLLGMLSNSVANVRSHPQELFVVLEDSVWLEYEISKFQQDIIQVKTTLSELRRFSSNNPNYIAVGSTEFQEFLSIYERTINAYNQLIQKLWQQIKFPNHQPERISLAKQQIVEAIRGDEATEIKVEFEKLSEGLILIQQSAEQQEEQANEQLNRANILRLQIIAASMVLSTLIAITLALLTSRAIARPVQILTNVAQKSIRESNFDLQVPVTRNDEIGILASSFNQLIHSVKQLLNQQQEANEQLESYSQTLEQKVEERTQELSEKNTNLKQLLAALHRTQSQMIQSEKMSSLGQLVAGIAHEINNPVNFIYGNLSYVDSYTQDLLRVVQAYRQHYPHPPHALQRELDEIDLGFLIEDLHKILWSMKVGAERIREIVLSLRNFSRLDEAECKAVNIHEGIDNTLLILQHRLKPKAERPEIQVVKEYGQLPLVECYPGQLNQVLMNLLANAIDALEESNRGRSFPEIATNPNTIWIHTQLMDENWIAIAIADNGPGMSEATRSRLFDPFFTTKPTGKGTGLGLSISYQIVVEKHGGRMCCNSTWGQGTQFVLEIPVRQHPLLAA